MKIIALLSMVLLSVGLGLGQTFNLDATTNGSTYTTCNATLYDSGGPSGLYGNDEDYFITFCSGTTDCMEVQFVGTFQVESGFDQVNIYDGNNTMAPLLASLDGNVLPGNVTTSGPCVTIQFTSDGSVTQDGFEANIFCTANCYVPPPPPTNTTACLADTLIVDSICNYITATNVSAPGSGVATPSCSWSYNGGDVWYQATVPASGMLEVHMGAGVITEGGMAIYSGPDCNNLTEIVCDEPWMMPVMLNVPSSLGLAGQTVWIRVWEQNNDNPGTFDICAFEPPPSIEVDVSTYTYEQLVTDVLVTGCLQANNVVYTGDPEAIGYFFNAFGVGIQEGVIMSSGHVMNAPGNGDLDFASDMLTTSNGDPLLDAIVTPDVTTDVTILEFDFVPSSDTLQFDFIFGSEEYPEFVFSFNDVFAFFLTGPNPGGGNYTNYNIALIPGTTTPVSIYNVNNGSNSPPTGPCVNCQYYVDNWAGTYDITYDGYTTPITAEAWVVPCQTYHIKLAVADVNDQSFDSAVLLKAGSFSSGGQVNMSHHSSSGGTVNEIIEGCENYWVFGRVDTTDLTDSIYVDLILSGTADTALDFNSFNSSFWISSGEIYDTLYYSAVLDNLPEGTEYIVFSLVNGCPCSTTTTSDTIWVFDNYDLNPTITPDDQICGGNNFTIDVNVNPQIDPSYIGYLWSNGSTSASITVSPAVTTTYTVTISHTCFPDTVLSMNLTVIPDLGAGFMISEDSVCIGDPVIVTFTDTAGVNATYQWTFNNGNPSSGNTQGPYTVTWSASGTYNIDLHVDDNGCVGDSTLPVVISPAPTIILTPQDATCNGLCDGSIAAAPQGTAIPFLYSWDNGQTSQNINGLCANTYNLTFTDANGCSSTDNATVSEPVQLTSTVSATSVSCYGFTDGTATVNASGGTGAYIYSWDDPAMQTTQTAINLAEGTYSVITTDANGCTSVSTITITGPTAPLTTSISGTDLSCYNGLDGIVNLECSGGTPAYNFIWNSGQTSEDLNFVPAGNYSVTITDANGCTSEETIVINEPTEIVYTTSAIPATCYGMADGSASINASGGTPPFVYMWSNGGMGASIINVMPGNYSVTVTDANGCTVTSTSYIDQPDKVVVSTNSDVWLCIGQNTDLNVSATGGTPGYNFFWNTGQTNSTINVNPVVTTTYSVYAEDINGCNSNTDYVIVNVLDPISIDVAVSPNEICVGDAVILTASATGGNGNYTYTLQNNSNVIHPPHTVYPGQNTTYTIQASDNCGSPTDEASVTVKVNPLPPVTFMPDTTNGCQPLTVQFVEINQDVGQTYSWNFGDYNSYNTSNKKDPEHTYNTAGVYTVGLTVTSPEGCKNTDIYQDLITVYERPEASFVADPEIASVINPNIHFINYSTLVDTCFWYFGDGDSTSDVNPQHQYLAQAGTYIIELYVESEYGCRDTSYSEVRIKDEYTFYAPTAFSPDNDLSNDEFFVTGNYIDENEFKFYIFNRWGEVVYESDDINARWDGKAKGTSRKCAVGTYTWLAIFKDKQGVEHQESGAVTIIR